MIYAPVVKSSDPDAKKRREVAVGLANNATGAAFGVVATGQALDLARRKMRDPNAKPPTKLSVRAGRAVARKFPRVGRAALKLKPKNPRNALLALGAVNVGGQALNAGLDAQSTAYFARERARLQREKKGQVVKFDSGQSVGYIRKAWESPEARRHRELGLATGLGAAATGAGAVSGVNLLRGYPLPATGKRPTTVGEAVGQAVNRKGKKKLTQEQVRIRGGLKRRAALVGVGAPLTYAAYRASRGDNERAWL